MNKVITDFDLNDNVALYLEKIMSGTSDEELKELFEEIYWKFPEIVKTMEINFKSIYLRNEKKINKYYEDRHKEFLQSHLQHLVQLLDLLFQFHLFVL